MSHDSLGQTIFGKVLITLVIAMVIVASVLWWQHRKRIVSVTAADAPKSDERASADTVTPEKATIENGLIVAQQSTAAKAARAKKTIQGTVTERPDFVSEIEWKVLQGVVKQGPDSEKELTHLVNKLLFAKKREAWQSLMASSRDPAQRHELATQLLDMMPAQLNDRSLDSAQAEKMKSELMADLNSKK